MPLRIIFEIILYLCGMQCLVYRMTFLCGFAHGYLKNSYLENRLIKAIPIVALHDDLSNWNVNNMLSKHCVYF